MLSSTTAFSAWGSDTSTPVGHRLSVVGHQLANFIDQPVIRGRELSGVCRVTDQLFFGVVADSGSSFAFRCSLLRLFTILTGPLTVFARLEGQGPYASTGRNQAGVNFSFAGRSSWMAVRVAGSVCPIRRTAHALRILSVERHQIYASVGMLLWEDFPGGDRQSRSPGSDHRCCHKRYTLNLPHPLGGKGFSRFGSVKFWAKRDHRAWVRISTPHGTPGPDAARYPDRVGQPLTGRCLGVHPLGRDESPPVRGFSQKTGPGRYPGSTPARGRQTRYTAEPVLPLRRTFPWHPLQC